MTKSLKGKMILSYLAVALLTVLVVSVVIRLTSGKSLMNLIAEEQTASLKDSAVSYYTENGTWEGFFSDSSQQGQFLAPPPPGDSGKRTDNHDFRGVAGMVDLDYRALIPTLGHNVGEIIPQNMVTQKVPVTVNGDTVAWILPDKSLQFQLNTEEKLFLQRTNLAIGLAALAGVIVAVAIGFLLASRLLKPIRQLTRASKELASGKLKQQVAVTSQDELGLLSQTFNQMSDELAMANEQRQRMTADITHDLSTPIQIISGYVEMIEKEDITLTPARIDIIKTELNHLRRMVADLSTITQVEAGVLEFHLEPLQPDVLLHQIFNTFQPIAAREGITLKLELAENMPFIQIDEVRMQQVMKNLLENALRHTPTGGEVIIGSQNGNKAQIFVKDNGEGIDLEDMPFVFDRFYRADKARGINSGKMGLGLAICRALVVAQGGEIYAESNGKGQGTTMIIQFLARV